MPFTNVCNFQQKCTISQMLKIPSCIRKMKHTATGFGTRVRSQKMAKSSLYSAYNMPWYFKVWILKELQLATKQILKFLNSFHVPTDYVDYWNAIFKDRITKDLLMLRWPQHICLFQKWFYRLKLCQGKKNHQLPKLRVFAGNQSATVGFNGQW